MRAPQLRATRTVAGHVERDGPECTHDDERVKQVLNALDGTQQRDHEETRRTESTPSGRGWVKPGCVHLVGNREKSGAWGESSKAMAEGHAHGAHQIRRFVHHLRQAPLPRRDRVVEECAQMLDHDDGRAGAASDQYGPSSRKIDMGLQHVRRKTGTDEMAMPTNQGPKTERQ